MTTPADSNTVRWQFVYGGDTPVTSPASVVIYADSGLELAIRIRPDPAAYPVQPAGLPGPD